MHALTLPVCKVTNAVSYGIYRRAMSTKAERLLIEIIVGYQSLIVAKQNRS